MSYSEDARGFLSKLNKNEDISRALNTYLNEITMPGDKGIILSELLISATKSNKLDALQKVFDKINNDKDLNIRTMAFNLTFSEFISQAKTAETETLFNHPISTTYRNEKGNDKESFERTIKNEAMGITRKK